MGGDDKADTAGLQQNLQPLVQHCHKKSLMSSKKVGELLAQQCTI